MVSNLNKVVEPRKGLSELEKVLEVLKKDGHYYGWVIETIEKAVNDRKEFVKDLDNLDTWNEVPWDCYNQIDELKEKWKGEKE